MLSGNNDFESGADGIARIRQMGEDILIYVAEVHSLVGMHRHILERNGQDAETFIAIETARMDSRCRRYARNRQWIRQGGVIFLPGISFQEQLDRSLQNKHVRDRIFLERGCIGDAVKLQFHCFCHCGTFFRNESGERKRSIFYQTNT